MNIDKALRRERKIQKRHYGMQVDGKNVFVSEEEKHKRAEQLRKEREEKEKLLELPIDN